MNVLNRRMFNVDPDHRKRIDYTTLPSTTASNVQPLDDPQVEPVGLGPNDLMIDGKVFTVSPNFEEMVESREIDGTTLYPIINSPNAEFGSNIERILRKFTKEDVPFGLGSFKSRGTFFRPEDVGSTVQDTGLDLLSILQYPVRAVAGFAGEVVGGPRGKKEFQSYIPNVPTDLERGLTKAGFIGELNDFTDDLEQVTQKTQESTEDPEQKVKEKTQTSETKPLKEVEESVKEVEESEYKDLDPENSPPPAPQVAANSLSNFFSSSAFNDALRNIGGSLVKEGRFGAGLASGAASFADEQEAKSLLEQERMAKLMAEAAKSGQMNVKDNKTIFDTKSELGTHIRDFNNAEAAYELAQSVVDFANKNQDLATFGSKIGATIEDIGAAIGVSRIENVEQMSDTKRAQIALDILANRNIKEILGESGRTISNIDRDIANRIIGNLNINKIQSITELKQRLSDNMKSIVEKKNDAQRKIISSAQFLSQYMPNLFKEDPELVEIMQKDFGAPTGTITTQDLDNLKPRVVKTTLRD